MEIRPIRDGDDRFAISHVYEESWKSAYRGIIPQAYLDAIPVGRWTKTVDDPARNSLVLLDGSKIVGTSSYGASRFVDRQGYGEIVSIYLLPEYFELGYGTQLQQAAMAMRLLSKTFVNPPASNSLIATGEVISFPSTRSSLA